MNIKLFRTLVLIGVCFLIAEVTLVTAPQRGVGGFDGIGAGGFPNQAAATPTPVPALPTGTASISGVVLRSNDRQPVAGAQIQISYEGGPAYPTSGPRPTTSATTDVSGRFSFRDIAIGTYFVRARREGFFGPALYGATELMVNVQTALTAAKPDASVEMLLIPSVTISGKVVDADGQPVPDARVSVVRIVYLASERTINTPGTAVTDVAGNYLIRGIEPGELYLRAAVRRNAAGNSFPQTVTYFPSAKDYSEATLLPAAAGSETIANIQILEGTRRRVTGRVMNAAAGTVSYALMPQGPGALDSIETAAIQRSATTDGTFQIETMRPGVYDLLAFMPNLAGRTTVDLRNQDATGVIVNLASTVDLDVQFVGVNAATRTRGGLSLTPVGTILPVALRPQLAGGRGAARGGQTSQTFTNIPEGKYSLITGGSVRTGYIADIRQGGKSILDEGVITIGKEKPLPVEVVVEAGGGVIQGSVQIPAEATVTRGLVVAIPEGPRRQNSLFYEEALRPGVALRATGPTNFSLTGITPGRYKVYAFAETIPPYAEQNAAFMKPYESLGVTVDVTLDSMTPSSITVPLIPRK
jgi:hypothetical protein